MKHTVYSHCAGDKHFPTTLKKEVGAAIDSISFKPAKGIGKKIRDAITLKLRESGWTGELAVSKGSNITITSAKGDVGLCLQTGNMGRLYADLMKLQTLYLNSAIKSAVIILPSKPIAKIIGDNIAEASRLERELEIFKKAYHVPTLVFAMEP